MAFDTDVLDAIHALAAQKGWPEAAFAAVVEVESNGKAFSRVDGRDLPLILFEPHVFYRCLPPSLRAEAVRRNLARPKWGQLPYPKTQAARYNQLERAKSIHEEAAYMACSWGVGQVLGENHVMLGLPTARALAEQAMSGIAGQLDLMARFIDATGLGPKLIALDWRGFARRYNGSGQVAEYAGRMERAFRRYGGQAVPVEEDDVTLRLGSRGTAVSDLQQNLRRLGYHLFVDGDFGPATEAAVTRFQSDNGLLADGIAGPVTQARVEALLGRDVIGLI